MFSACFAGGLIEAHPHSDTCSGFPRFPPVLQAASLKQDGLHPRGAFAQGFPPVLQAASLKLTLARGIVVHDDVSACFAGGLIEAYEALPLCCRLSSSFPPVLQAASLKPDRRLHHGDFLRAFSACFAGGLIEARACSGRSRRASRFPPVLQAASLKPRIDVVRAVRAGVFRLFCRRPH